MKALRSGQGALESARVVFTLPWSHLPRTRAYVGGTLKKLFVGIHAAWGVVVGREAGRPLWGDGFLMGEPPSKGTTGRSNAGRRKQKDSPKDFTRGITTHFCTAKEKAVLDSEKEKVDRWKFWGPSHPVGVGVLTRPPLSQHPPTKAAWISTNKERYSTHSTAVAQKGPRVAQTQAADQ